VSPARFSVKIFLDGGRVIPRLHVPLRTHTALERGIPDSHTAGGSFFVFVLSQCDPCFLQMRIKVLSDWFTRSSPSCAFVQPLLVDQLETLRKCHTPRRRGPLKRARNHRSRNQSSITRRSRAWNLRSAPLDSLSVFVQLPGSSLKVCPGSSKSAASLPLPIVSYRSRGVSSGSADCLSDDAFFFSIHVISSCPHWCLRLHNARKKNGCQNVQVVTLNWLA